MPADVCIVREGCLELAVIQTLRAGDIDGDIQILLGKPMPYETRADTETASLMLSRRHFEALLATHPQLSRRWLTGVTQRRARPHHRLTSLLGQPETFRCRQKPFRPAHESPPLGAGTVSC